MENTELYDIYGLWYVPFWQTNTFKYVVIGLGCVMLTFILWHLIKKYRAKKTQVPAWEQALQKLTAVKNKTLLSPEHCELFYVEITNIIKEYLQGRYQYDVHHKTDQELITFLRSKKFDTLLVDEVEAVLSGALVVKFAHEQVIKDQLEQDFNKTVAVIKRTIPTQKQPS